MKRLSVNINDETADALVTLAAKRSTTITEIVRRAVSVLKTLQDYNDDPNMELALRDRTSGNVQRFKIV